MSLIDRLRAQRESWVDVAEGKRIKVRRPPEVELAKFIRGVEFDMMVAALVDWEGFTEADLLGSAVGSDSVVPFDRALVGEYLSDKTEMANKVVGALVDSISKHLESIQAAKGN